MARPEIPRQTCSSEKNYITKNHPNYNIKLAYSPENLRLGNAINVFTNPDRVIVGVFEEKPVINTEEVQSYKWMPLEDVKNDIEMSPEIYTEWFKIIFKESFSKISSYNLGDTSF